MSGDAVAGRRRLQPVPVACPREPEQTLEVDATVERGDDRVVGGAQLRRTLDAQPLDPARDGDDAGQADPLGRAVHAAWAVDHQVGQAAVGSVARREERSIAG